MTSESSQILSQAMNLSSAEREELAEQLYLSLHSTGDRQQEVDTAWGEEILRRLREVEEGNVALIPSDIVHQQIDRILHGD